jgi:DnaJ family protein C protein 7
LHKLERHEEALQDMEQLRVMYEHDEVVKHWHEQAQFKVRKAKRPDYYGLLNVPSVASESEVKAAYKRAALVCHPDKLGPTATAEQRAEAEAAFKRIGEALEILGDQTTRKLYDEGFDREGIQEQMQRMNSRSGHGHGHGH